MLSILCLRLTIKVKVGIPGSFNVGWYPPKKTGSSHLKATWEINLIRASDTYTNPRPGQYTTRMSTGKSPGQPWQPWTVDSPSLGLIFIEQPSDFCTVNALIIAKQVSMTISLPRWYGCVHATTPIGWCTFVTCSDLFLLFGRCTNSSSSC